MWLERHGPPLGIEKTKYKTNTEYHQQKNSDNFPFFVYIKYYHINFRYQNFTLKRPGIECSLEI
jgi:hypothetical protein